MKIMTLGNGFVADHLPYEKIVDHDGKPFRLWANKEYVEDMLFQCGKPDVIVNCIGRCGTPNVDWCEKNRAETYEANVVIPLMLAQQCDKYNIRLIHIGSGCIFFGESPNYYLERHGDPHYNEDELIRVDTGWKEEDFANPASYYSKTKYACDLALGQMGNTTTLRIRMPISDRDTPRNFINKIKAYKQIIDIPNSVTFMSDLTRCIEHVIEKDLRGIYHVVNPEPLSAAQVMREYQKYVPDHKFDIITEQQLDQITTAKRSNCIINGDKLRHTWFDMTNSEKALQECMKAYCNSEKRDVDVK